jgi:alpha-galactosidase
MNPKAGSPCRLKSGFLILLYPLWLAALSFGQEPKPLAPDDPLNARVVRIETDREALTLFADKDGRLYQLGFGARSDKAPVLPKKFAWQQEFYPQWGDGFIAEPALQATHADGNTSTDLLYVRHESKPQGDGITLTRIEMKDPAYPFFVTLCFRTYAAFDVIEEWTEIRHEEAGAVQLDRFASSSPFFSKGDLYVTQFCGDYSNEMNPLEERLTDGIKVFDSKIGVRADQYRNPSFLLSRGGIARENAGEVWAGSLAWPGSFQFAFECGYGITRALCGMNPFNSTYKLEPNSVFTTPAMIWAWSGAGTGPLSRNLHRWARQYGLRDGNSPRAVVLNNWEATGTNFDQKKLVSLFDGAREIGCDLFLLDDGWFGGKYPRNADSSGLGDWKPDPKKLPSGIGYLCEQAKSRGLRFGIWMEPEMVNPRSELFEQHPDWAIQQPHRQLQTSRNQLVLDLSRPEVTEYVFKCVDDLLSQNPGVSYIKWDCNRYLTQPGSTWLKPGMQTHLEIDYNNNLLDIMRNVAARHPEVEMMLCSGGGGRVDFGSLRYFDEFWPSDNTNPLRRVSMQWDYSTFFPAIAISGHVTRMGNQPIKFAFDVAMSERLGMDVDLAKYSPQELAFAASAIDTYKTRILPAVQFGDLYRLENPHTSPRSALDYVATDRAQAVVFILQTSNAPARRVKPEGLDPGKQYRVLELNLPQGVASSLPENGKTIDGATLMREGLFPQCAKQSESAVIELQSITGN